MKVFEKQIENQVIFFALPIAGFIFSFAYQSGIFYGFDMDSRFIIPSTIQIFKSSLLVGIFTFLIIVFRPYIKFARKWQNLLTKSISAKSTRGISNIARILALILLILLSLYALVAGWLINANLIVLALSLALWLTILILNLDHIEIKSRMNILKNVPGDELSTAVCAAKLAVFFTVGYIFVFTFGYMRADLEYLNSKSVLTTTINDNKYLVIVNNGDSIYAKQYDKKSGKLSDSFIVTESKNKTFISEKLTFN